MHSRLKWLNSNQQSRHISPVNLVKKKLYSTTSETVLPIGHDELQGETMCNGMAKRSASTVAKVSLNSNPASTTSILGRPNLQNT